MKFSILLLALLLVSCSVAKSSRGGRGLIRSDSLFATYNDSTVKVNRWRYLGDKQAQIKELHLSSPDSLGRQYIERITNIRIEDKQVAEESLNSLSVTNMQAEVARHEKAEEVIETATLPAGGGRAFSRRILFLLLHVAGILLLLSRIRKRR